MPYSISFSDPGKSSNPITVNDLTENNTSTSLSLVGRNYSNYGVAVAKSFVHLLENFASPISPNNSIEGQLWYNNSTKRLYINDSTGGTNNWRPAGGTHVAPTLGRPTNALLGDLWVDTLTQQLNLYNGTDWVLVGPSALSGKKSGVYVEAILDSSGIEHFVTIEYNNDSAIKIIATESFIPQKTIEGFNQLNPGINITGKKFIGPGDTTIPTTGAKIHGSSTSADALNVLTPSIETVSADNFARRDTLNLFYGQQSILNDAGITIGTANNLSLAVVQGAGVIKNTVDGGSIDMVIAYQGSNNVILKIDGKNKRVGINHPLPNAELDVNGDAFISGHLVTTGILDSTSPTSGSLQIRGGAGIAKNLYVGKNITASGHLRVGELDEFGGTIAGPAIIPQASNLYDIGTPTNRFKTVYADTFSGAFSGAFTGTVTGTVIGAASSLAASTNFQLGGDLTSPSPVSFNGTGGTITIGSTLADSAIRGKPEVLDNRTDDTILIHRSNVGLRRVTRTSFLLGEAFVPIGSIFPFAATAVPLGYLLCDGALVSRTEYPTLYQTIGTTYGSGAGGTYFRLPDLRGRFPLGNAGMANSFANPVVQKTVVVAQTSQTSVTVSNTDNISIGMQVSSTDATILQGTIVTSIPNSNTVVLNNQVTASANATLTFTLVVLRESLPLNSTDRVSNRTGNFTASTNGGEGGTSQHTLNTFSNGSDQIQFSPGSGQTLNRNFNIPITNPYLTINYIIRAGVGSSQIG
jgi:microcystin-dependent protein